VTSVLDLFPTALALAGAEAPSDPVLDGQNLLPLLRKGGAGAGGDAFDPDKPYFYYRDQHLYAVRKGPWKAHYVTRAGYGPEPAKRHDPPLLFHLGHDPSERHDVAQGNPDVLADLAREVEQHRKTLVPVEPQLE
jgi:arylsulfatase A-like enzyme